MSDQERKELSNSRPWGVPDWRDASAYPDETESLLLWRWEFLRRREDYRKDWLQYAPKTYEKKKADFDLNPVSRWTQGYRKSTGEPIIHEWPKILLPVTDLNFKAEMPGSEEKYQLQWLLHPANPHPEFLSFLPYDGLIGVEYEVGLGNGISQYWDLECTVFPHELILRFDLTTKPVQELMAALTRPLPLSPESREFLNMRPNVKGSFFNRFRNLDDSPSPPKDKKNGPPSPRYLKDSHHPGVIYVIWDTRQPSGSQQKEITAHLTHLQSKLPVKPKARRARPSAWTNFLRVLDAREVNPITQNYYATYQEIGEIVYGCRDYGSAQAQAYTAYEDACRIREDFPT